MSTSCPPDVFHVIGVPTPSPFFVALPLPCITYNERKLKKASVTYNKYHCKKVLRCYAIKPDGNWPDSPLRWESGPWDYCLTQSPSSLLSTITFTQADAILRFWLPQYLDQNNTVGIGWNTHCTMPWVTLHNLIHLPFSCGCTHNVHVANLGSPLVSTPDPSSPPFPLCLRSRLVHPQDAHTSAWHVH